MMMMDSQMRMMMDSQTPPLSVWLISALYLALYVHASAQTSRTQSFAALKRFSHLLMRFIYYESNLYLINVAKCCWFERSCARIVSGITLKSAKQIGVWLSTAQEIFLTQQVSVAKKLKVERLSWKHCMSFRGS